jgi:hypothetical protein
MTVTTATKTRHYTEADLLALSLSFEVRGSEGERRFYVDGLEVTEAEYLRAFEAATGEAVTRPTAE